MKLSEIRKTVEKLREQPISLPDKNMALYPVPTVMYLAQHAIDLAAENERLKAKLDAVRAECNKPITITSDVFGGGIASGHNILKQAVLAIIDKDGDET